MLFSVSSSLTFSFKFSFSFLRTRFSFDNALIWSSSWVTYSFFFFLLMQADSLFLIILCCLFRFLNSSALLCPLTVGTPVIRGLQNPVDWTGSVLTKMGPLVGV